MAFVIRADPKDAEARRRGDEHQLAALRDEVEGHKKLEREARETQKEIEAELEALAPLRNDTIVSGCCAVRLLIK